MTLFTDSPYEKMMIQKPEENDDTETGGREAGQIPARFLFPALRGLPLSGAVPLYWVLYQKDRKRQTAGTLKGGFFIDFTYLSNR